jgi:integrase
MFLQKTHSKEHVRNTNWVLNNFNKHADLNKPETVSQFIANLPRTNSYKHKLAIAYSQYCKFHQIEWKPTAYPQDSKPIKIPTNEKLEMLIANAGKTMATKLTLSKETGLGPIELCNLKTKDLDQRLVYPTTAKHGAPRTLKISHNLTRTLQNHINRNNLNPNDKLFKGDATHYGKDYREQRNNLAKKLNDPTIKNIRLYDFRHYFATDLYHKTKDILYVKQQLGHKRIETTLIYTQLLNLNDDEWTCKTATNIQQATELIENGFEYIQEIDGIRLYRKRK